MKIYTYYDNIGFQNQDSLIALWQYSWENHNFKPIILSKEDAIRNTSYIDFKNKIYDIHKTILNQPLSEYGWTCYARWLAYAAQNHDEYFYFSDYDIINNNFDPEMPKPDQFCLLDDCCPCFGTASVKLCQDFCDLILNISISELEKISQNYELSCYHDQDFLVINRSIIKDISWINLSRDRTKFADFYYYNSTNSCSVIHFAHRNMELIKTENKQEFDDIDIDTLRIYLIKKLLCL